MPVRIVTDSACDLPEALCESLGIEVVPLTIRFGEREYVDRKELSTEAFWRELDAASVLPETAAPSVGAFEETFRNLADDGADGIVCVNLSASLSATMQSAQVAAKALDGQIPIAVVDSKSASMGIGNLAMYAARRAGNGAGVAEIVSEIEERRGRQHVYAALDTLEYLRKGGRIGGAQALLGSMLSIKPVIKVIDGAVEEGGKVRTRSKALRFLVDQVPDGLESISVLHAMAPDVDEFLALLEPKVPGAEVTVGTIGPVIGVHVGPRTMGIGFIHRSSLIGARAGRARRRHRTGRARRGRRRGRAGRAAAPPYQHRARGVPPDPRQPRRRARRHARSADLDRAQDRIVRRPLALFDVGVPRRHQRRARRGSAPQPPPTAHRNPPGSRPPAPARPTTRSPQRLDIDAALAQLSPEYRAAVALRDLVGMDYAEIGEVLGLPPGTVRSRISRGRAALADILGNQETGLGTSNPRNTMNDTPAPLTSDQVDELLSAELDDDFDAAARDLGLEPDDARVPLHATPGTDARRRRSLVAARDALAAVRRSRRSHCGAATRNGVGRVPGGRAVFGAQ